MEEIDINFLFSKFLHVTVLERWTRLASLQSCRHYWSILFQSHLPSLVADWKNSYGAGIQTPKPHWSIKTPIRDSFLRSAPIQARRRPATLPDQLDTWVVWWLLSLQQQKRHKTSSGFVFTLNKQPIQKHPAKLGPSLLRVSGWSFPSPQCISCLFNNTLWKKHW